MNNPPNLAVILIKAAEARQAGKWDEARELYQQARSLDPNNLEAERELSNLKQLKKTDTKVQENIAKGDRLLDEADYGRALEAYTEALPQAGHVGILKYHAVLEQKRNQARELKAWQDRMREVVQQATRLRKQGEKRAALQHLDRLLDDLPEGEAYVQIASEPRQMREAILSEIGADDLLNQAREAFKVADFEQAIRLAGAISSTSPARPDAQRLIAMSEDRLQRDIRPELENAEKSVQEQKWDDAFAALNNLRTDFPQNPTWKRLWLQVGMAHGQQALDRGRQDNTVRNFGEASKQFQQARNAFEKVLDVYPKHETAPILRDEAAELRQVALEEAQAQTDWQAGRREETRMLLAQAQQRLKHAQDEGHDYAAVAAVVGVMHKAVSDEIARIEEQERTLQDGERRLKEHDLDKATQCFRSTLNALLSEHQRWAADGLNRVEAEQRLFEADVERAKAAADPSAAVVSYQAAYDRWPTAPEIARTLEGILLEAGEAALAKGRGSEAIGYFNRVLTLNPDNRTARIGIGRPGVKDRVEAVVAETRSGLEQLTRQPDVRADAFQPLLKQLDDILDQTKDYPDLKTQIETLRSQTQERWQRWHQFEATYANAENRRESGEWEGAVELFSQALKQLGDSATPELRERFNLWQVAQQSVQTALQRGQQALQQARKAYGITEDTDFDAVLESLQQTETALHHAQQSVMAAGGKPTPAFENMQQQATELRLRAAAALEAENLPSASDGLIKVREIIRLRGVDPTLEALAQRLEEKVRQFELPALVQEANRALEIGEVDRAYTLLQTAHSLQPGDREIANSYLAVHRRQQLEQKLRNIEKDYTLKLSGSPVDACNELLKGLIELSASPDLPAEGRGILQELIAYSERDGRLALARKENWPLVQDLERQLVELGMDNWVIRRAAQMADPWWKLARDVALQGLRASRTQMGNFLEAFRAAALYLDGHPQDPKAIQELAGVQEMLINQLNESSRKRIGRAEEALQRGEFEAALNNLESLEGDFYGKVDKEFPGLIDKYPDVENLRRQAEAHKAEARNLEKVYKIAEPRLVTAEDLCLKGNLDDAEKELQILLPSLDQLASLKPRGDDLQRRIVFLQTDKVRKALDATIKTAEAGLPVATTREQFDKVLSMLESLPKEVNLDRLPADERRKYHLKRDEALQKREELVSGETQHSKAETLIQEKNYVLAVAAIEAALKVTRDGEKKGELQLRLRAIQPLAEKQQRRESACETGRAQLTTGIATLQSDLDRARQAFTLARKELMDAQTLGAVVDDRGVKIEDLLSATRAGLLFADAYLAFERGENLEEVENELTEVINLSGDNFEASLIKAEADRLQSRLKKQRAAQETQRQLQRKLQSILEAAETDRLAGELDVAAEKVQSVLTEQPDHPKAHELSERIRRTRQVQTLFQRAQALEKEGKDDEALAIVNTLLGILPDYTEGLIFKQRIEAGREAKDALRRAEIMAYNTEFQQARQALRKAVELNAPSERVRQVQQLIEGQEKKWQADIENPIRERVRSEKYEDALQLCRQALQRASSQDFRLTLENLQSDVVNRWVEHSLNRVRQALQKTKDEETVRDFISELEGFKSLEPAPSAGLVRDINALKREANTDLLNHRLTKASQLFEDKRHAEALDILKSIQDEASSLGLGRIAFQADSLVLDIEAAQVEQRQAREAEAERRDREQYDQLKTRAEQLLQEAANRQHLQQSCELARQIFNIPRFKSDWAANDLLARAERALRLFDEAEAAIQRSRDEMLARHFREAENALLLSEVPSLLPPLYERQRMLVNYLVKAEADQDRRAWDVALSGYRQAIDMEPTLGQQLKSDLDRCQQQLTDQLITQIRQILSTTSPQPETARSYLERAEANKHIASTALEEIDALRDWITSQQFVAQAARILEQEDSDPQPALEALSNARMKHPPSQPDTQLVGWETLARALLFWRQQDLERTESAIQNLQPPISNLPRARALREAVTRASHVESVIQSIQTEFEDALKETQRYDKAVALVRQALDQANEHPAALDMQHRVRVKLQTDMQAARLANRYADAISLGKLLLELLPTDEETNRLVASLPGERSQKLSEALRQTEEALNVYDLGWATSTIERAQTIVVPEGNAQVSETKRRLEQLRIKLEQINGSLGDLETEIGHAETYSDWESIVEESQKIFKEAPRYLRVLDKTKELQDHLTRLANARLTTEQFTQALEFCKLALRFGSRDDLVGLVHQIEVTRDDRLAGLRQTIQRALESWDLETAQEPLDRCWTFAPNDSQVGNLRKQANAMSSLASDIQSDLRAGWEHLWNCRYQGAIETFGQVLETVSRHPVPNFLEAQAWRDYTINLENGIQAVLEEEDFTQGARLLETAEGLLRVHSGVTLPSIAGGENTLREQRRQAVYLANRLRQSARLLSDLDARYKALRFQPALSAKQEALKLFRQMEQETRNFARLQKTPAMPPADFSAEDAAGSTSLPSADRQPPVEIRRPPMPAPEVITVRHPSDRPATPPPASEERKTQPEQVLEAEEQLETEVTEIPGQLPRRDVQQPPKEPTPQATTPSAPTSAPSKEEEETPLIMDWGGAMGGFTLQSYDEEDSS